MTNSELATTASHGFQVGDCVTYPLRLSRWDRLWRALRYMRHNVPEWPVQTLYVVSVSNSFEVERETS
jgi:hypothetical protein